MTRIVSSYYLTDPQVMDQANAPHLWTENERRSLESIVERYRSSGLVAVPVEITPDERITGSIVNVFTFLGVPVKRTMSYEAGSRPGYNGVGRTVVKFEVFTDGS